MSSPPDVSSTLTSHRDMGRRRRIRSPTRNVAEEAPPSHLTLLRNWAFDEFCELENTGSVMSFYGLTLGGRCLYCSLFKIFKDFCQISHSPCCSEDFFQLVVYTMLFVDFVLHENHLTIALGVEKEIVRVDDETSSVDRFKYESSGGLVGDSIFGFIMYHLGSNNTIEALEQISDAWMDPNWFNELEPDDKGKLETRLGYQFGSVTNLIYVFGYKIGHLRPGFSPPPQQDLKLVISIVDFFTSVYFFCPFWECFFMWGSRY